MLHEVVDGQVLPVQTHVREEVELMPIVFQDGIVLLMKNNKNFIV
jgi:hypothetical protein